MHRVPRYRRQGWHKWLVGALVLAFGWLIYSNWPLWRGFSPQDLVENSELKAKSLTLPVKEVEFAGGQLKAYMLEDNSNLIISLNFRFRNAGYASDNEHEQGIAQMAAALLTEGAGSYSEQELKEELAARAIKVSFAAEKDDFSGSVLTTKANADKAAELLRLMLTEPRFAEPDIKRVKLQMQEALKRQNEHPAKILERKFAQELYNQHPYGRNPLGRKEDIARLTRKDLQKFVRDNFSRNNLLVGVAGDVNPAEAELWLNKIFGTLPTSGQINFVREAEPKFDGRTRIVERESGQNIFLGALSGVGRNHEDFYPLFVANYIWGGAGLTSRLSQQIREKNGLTYGIYSYLGINDKSPLLLVSYAATADKFAMAEKLLDEELGRIQKQGISATELDKAKNYLIASYNLRFASIENIAEILTAMQKYNLGLDFLQKRNDYIASLSLERVNAVAKKYFDKDQMVRVEIGKF